MKQQNRFWTAVVVLLVLFHTAAAQPAPRFSTEEKKITYMIKNLSNGLVSGNDGVIASSLHMASVLALKYPGTPTAELKKLIDGIRQTHPSGTVRYKAYIASTVCENPEWFAADERLNTAEEPAFFRAASEKIREHYLSVNE